VQSLETSARSVVQAEGAGVLRRAAPASIGTATSGFRGRAEDAGGRRDGVLRLVAWGAASLLLLFLALPLAALVWRTAGDPAAVSPATTATLRQAITLSLLTSSLALLVIVLFGTPLAYLLARRPFPGARLVDGLIGLPVVLPPAVAGIALLMAFGRYGVVGRWLNELGITVGFTTMAVILAQIFIAAPFFVRAGAAGFTRVDRDLEEAAADLGASPPQVFRTVTLPLAAPSLLAGAVLAWARALGEFGATILFAGNFPGVTQTMPLAIYSRFGAGDLPAALFLSLVLLALSLVVLFSLRLSGDRAVRP
jgi:molybdate transport system permease protein